MCVCESGIDYSMIALHQPDPAIILQANTALQGGVADVACTFHGGCVYLMGGGGGVNKSRLLKKCSWLNEVLPNRR